MVSELTQKLVAEAAGRSARHPGLLGTLVPLGLLWALSFHVVQSSRLLAVALTPLAAAFFAGVCLCA